MVEGNFLSTFTTTTTSLLPPAGLTVQIGLLCSAVKERRWLLCMRYVGGGEGRTNLPVLESDRSHDITKSDEKEMMM